MTNEQEDVFANDEAFEDNTGLDIEVEKIEPDPKYSKEALGVFHEPQEEDDSDHRIDLLIGAKNHERLLAVGVRVMERDDAPKTGRHVKPTGDMFTGEDETEFNKALELYRQFNRKCELMVGSPKNIEKLREFGYQCVDFGSEPLTPHITDGRSAAKVADDHD